MIKLLFFLSAVCCISCNQSNSQELHVDPIEVRMAILKSFNGENDKSKQKKFFDAFPTSFAGMQKLFGYDDDSGAAPLYEIGENIIKHFSQLKHIDAEQYYNKYINICIDGKWEADNISEGFGIGTKLFSDTAILGEVLSKREEKEIRSVFSFIFDGPHPEGNKEYFEKLYRKVQPINMRLANLMKQAYEDLLSKYDGHGH